MDVVNMVVMAAMKKQLFIIGTKKRYYLINILILLQLLSLMILFVSSEHRIGAHKLYESLGYAVDKVNGYRKRFTNE